MAHASPAFDLFLGAPLGGHPSLDSTLPQMRAMADELFEAMPDLEPEQAANGMKCLHLALLGMAGHASELAQADALVKQASALFAKLHGTAASAPRQMC